MKSNLLAMFLLAFPFLAGASSPTPQNLSADTLVAQAKNKVSTNPDSSLLLLHSALGIFQKKDQLEAWIDACKNLGVAFDMAGNLATAMQVYGFAKTEKLFRQPRNGEEWEALGWLYANAGYTMVWYGKYYGAKNWYEQAYHIFEENVPSLDTTDVAYVHRELGNLYTRFGEHEAAVTMLERTRQIALEQGAANLAAEAANDLAIAYADHEKHEKTIETCRKALEQKRLNIVTEALLQVTMSMACAEIGQLKEARTHAEIGEKLLHTINQKALDPSSPLRLSLLLILQSQILENPTEAEDALRRSQFWLEKVYPDTMRREFAKLRMAEAAFLLKNKRPLEALQKQHTALRTVLYRFSDPDPLALPDPAHFYPENTILEALSGKAKAFRQLYEDTGERAWLEHALACHGLIFEAEQAYRQVHHFESSKLTLLSESSRRTESAIETAWQLYQDFGEAEALEKAFGFSEKSKSILLYEALRHSGASSIANVPDSLLVREREMRESLAEVEKSLFFKNQNGDTSSLPELNHRVLELTGSIQALVEKMEREHPAFSQAKLGGEALSLAEIQAMLTDDQALVEYFVGEKNIFIFLVKKGGLHVERVAKDFPLEQWVADFREGIEAFQFSGNDRAALCESYTELGHSLYEKLLQPLENQGLPDKLTIIPGGALSFLPFDALLFEQPSAKCVFKKYPYLMRRHQVSYSYSAALLQMLRQKAKKETAGQFAAFAPAFPEGNTSGFGKLDGNVASAEEIAKLMGGDTFAGTAASRKNLTEGIGHFSSLYLATHAKANMDENGFSFIVLAGGHSPTWGTKGAYDTLFVKDIYNFPTLSADLVFLGACETGSGKFYEGEGIISLARSFLYAGAKSIVTTLWSINDDSNRELTFDFFKNLKSGQTKDEALRNAKLSMLGNDRPDLYAHPVYWAAYTPIGDMREVKNETPWGWVLVGGALAGLGVLYFLGRKK